MSSQPIYNGVLQSDLDFAGFSALNVAGGLGGGGGDITTLINGQDYVQVLFDDVQTNSTWTFTQCLVVNTADSSPLNIVPATLTEKSTTGFRLQLSVAPDSGNYSLHWNFTGTGGGTAVGGGYTLTDTTVSGQNVRLIVPAVRITGAAIVYCHGLGETVTSGSYFDPTTSDKTLYMLDALAAGYLLAAGDFHGYQWSNATAQTDIEALVAHLVANYSVTEIVLWSQSAGGPLGLVKATEGFSGVTVRGWFGIFPVVDLDAAHSGALTASIDAAFPSYPTGTTGCDPIDLAASAYNGLRLRCCGSSADTTVPATAHGDALVLLTTGHATESVCVATTGGHGDASNFTQARADDFIAFLSRCF